MAAVQPVPGRDGVNGRGTSTAAGRGAATGRLLSLQRRDRSFSREGLSGGDGAEFIVPVMFCNTAAILSSLMQAVHHVLSADQKQAER